MIKSTMLETEYFKKFNKIYCIHKIILKTMWKSSLGNKNKKFNLK